MFSQPVGHSTEPDRREKIDGEAGIPRRVDGEQPAEYLPHIGVTEPLLEDAESQSLGQLLHEDLDEYARGRGGIILVELDVLNACPRQRVGAQEVCEELCDIPKLIRLEAMNRRVLCEEYFVE